MLVAVVMFAGVMAGPAAAVRQLAPRSCGSGWTVATQPVPPAGDSELDAVAASSATDAWAVGHAANAIGGPTHTLIERWDGAAWSVAPAADGPSSTTSTLAGVADRTSTDAWAVGTFSTPTNLFRTLIERWDGASWSRVPSPNGGHPAGGGLSGVVALATDDAWAVGGFGQGAPGRTMIEHWDGTSWSVVASPNKTSNPNSLAAVAAVAPNDVWAVGTLSTKAFTHRTLTLHWDGTSWRRVKSPNVGPNENDLLAVAALAADDVWAVGFAGTRTLTEHWNGTRWSIVKSPTPGGNADLAGVVAPAADDVWAVGSRVDRPTNALHSLVERWDGVRWRVVASDNRGSSDNRVSGVAGDAAQMFAVGSWFRGGGAGPLAPLVLDRCGP